MKKHRVPTSAILWAAAIIASALLGGSRFLSPDPAAVPGAGVPHERNARRTCLNRSELS